jgi:hypothetical protein
MIFLEKPPGIQPVINVWWCPQGTKHIVRILESLKWIGVHWLNGRSRPCFGDDCPEPWHQRPVNWKGYAAAMRSQKNPQNIVEWVPIILEVSHDLGKHLLNKNLVNLLVEVERDRKPHAPVIIRFPKPWPLPPAEAWDIVPILLNLWGLKEPAGEQTSPDQGATLPFRKQA